MEPREKVSLSARRRIFSPFVLSTLLPFAFSDLRRRQTNSKFFRRRVCLGRSYIKENGRTAKIGKVREAASIKSRRRKTFRHRRLGRAAKKLRALFDLWRIPRRIALLSSREEGGKASGGARRNRQQRKGGKGSRQKKVFLSPSLEKEEVEGRREEGWRRRRRQD